MRASNLAFAEAPLFNHTPHNDRGNPVDVQTTR